MSFVRAINPEEDHRFKRGVWAMQILSWAKLICNLYSGEVGKDEEGAKKADLEACSKGGRVWARGGLHGTRGSWYANAHFLC